MPSAAKRLILYIAHEKPSSLAIAYSFIKYALDTYIYDKFENISDGLRGEIATKRPANKN